MALTNHQLSVRFSVELYDQLRIVSETENRPMNKVVQEAVHEYLEKVSPKLADKLSSRVEALRRYNSDAATNRRAVLDSVIEAEAKHGGSDPVEGTRVDEDKVVAPKKTAAVR